ncbi:ATP-binding protein [bacterium]|nr:ATP-binding protein [bacterium]
MNELLVISGKGGTGKTSLTAAFARLAENVVLADCDVDAADLHLLLAPEIRERHEFYSGQQAQINQLDCTVCGICNALCRFNAIELNKNNNSEFSYTINSARCEGCGVCVRFCPENAITSQTRHCGQWMVSDTAYGPMVHAKLDVAAENSGKLVTTVRDEARRIAQEQNRSMILIDGPPGIGCPVIASLTGVNKVLIVTEPTLSGEHDLKRVLDLADHFGIPAAVCVNKWDINPSITDSIEAETIKRGSLVAGKIPWDNSFTVAQLQAKTILEVGNEQIVNSINSIWECLTSSLLIGTEKHV